MRTRRFTRFLAAALSLILMMSGSILTAALAEEPYTIVYAFDVWVQQADWDKVEENLSKLVEGKIGARVKLLPMTGANYTQQINLMISSGEKLDMYNASARTTFSSDITSDKIMGLSPELVRQYAPDAYAACGDFLNATTMNGLIYGFPTLRDMANAYGIYLSVETAAKYGVEIDENMMAYMTIEELDALFAKMKEGETDRYVTQPQSQSTSILDSLFVTYDNMGDDMGVLLDYGLNSYQLVNLFESDYYKACLEWARKWNNAGYILPDASTNPDTGVAYFKTGKVASTMTLVHPGVPIDNTIMSGIPTCCVIVNPAFSNTKQVGAIINSVTATCENPQKVLEFINLLFSDAEVYNALVWGLEGVHYKHVEGSDVLIDYPDGVTADTSGYTLGATYNFGSRYNSYIWNGAPEDLNDRYRSFNDSAIQSGAMGFLFDSSSVKTEVAAVQAVFDQYRLPLENGVIDPEENLPKFILALKDAGIDTVIAEKQRQLDQWVASR